MVRLLVSQLAMIRTHFRRNAKRGNRETSHTIKIRPEQNNNINQRRIQDPSCSALGVCLHRSTIRTRRLPHCRLLLPPNVVQSNLMDCFMYEMNCAAAAYNRPWVAQIVTDTRPLNGLRIEHMIYLSSY